MLYEISLLTGEQFDNGIRQHTITPEATIDDIRLLRNKVPHSAGRRAEVERPQVDVPPPSDPEEVAELATLLTHAEPVVTSSAAQAQRVTEAPQAPTANATQSRAGRTYRLVVIVHADSREIVQAFKQEIERDLGRFPFAEPQVEIYDAD